MDILDTNFRTICNTSLLSLGINDTGGTICSGLIERYLVPTARALGETRMNPEELCQLFSYCIAYNTTQLSLGAPMTLSGKQGRVGPTTREATQRIYRKAEASFLKFATSLVARRAVGTAKTTSPEIQSEPVAPNTTMQPDRPHSNRVAALFAPKPSYREMLATHGRRGEERSHRRDQPASEATDVIRILQITDIHLDFEYQRGTNPNCASYMCCRGDSGPGNAGHFGDYQCDLPVQTLKSMFAYINATLAYPGNPSLNASSAPNGHLDFAIWTGGNSAHDIWKATWESSFNASSFIARELFSNLPGLQVYPTFGTYETYPANLFDIQQDKHILDAYANLFNLWLSNDTLSSFRDFGTYSASVRPGLKVLSMNSMFSIALNVHNAVNPQRSDFADQEEFLNQAFLDAEEAGDKIFGFTHLPVGSADATARSGAYISYLSTMHPGVMKWVASGHTHRDMFQLVHPLTMPSSATGRPQLNTALPPVSVWFHAPSLSTFQNTNPAFRIYTLNATTMEMIDHETHFFNLTAANDAAAALLALLPSNTSVNASIERQLDEIALSSWSKLYTMKQTFEMPDLSPASFGNLSQTFRNDRGTGEVMATLATSASEPRPCAPETCGIGLHCTSNYAILNYYAGCIVGLTSTSPVDISAGWL
ncbi:acid sphingomyelinase [Capsaspora owczarzaki ATCC 30864]|uniref:acid sphingomyelinase n=1 Tax=Capsaspora owczarzaki (strain ATCC 30864) TaxID=595528 RepID=UPI0001FE27FA|nr:acid sphingomyelinase [Capsaspora owczarzaki ATCC 30864]|eukprot:XP_004343764.1 acid sphingomyelinase [Capsaspora owczarzaki ATCC 30864]